MLTVNEAREKIIENIKTCKETIEIPFFESAGYVLAEDIISNIDVPDFPKSAMDGYAFNHKDLIDGDKFKVIGENAAGDFNNYDYKKNTCVRVMTGAYVPECYDCVVKQEDVIIENDMIKVLNPVGKHFNYCVVGEDIKKGETLIKSGTVINSGHIGIFAGIGLDKIKVYRPLKVSLISTGSELTKPGEKLEPGKIYAISTFMIESILEKYKIEVVSNKIIDDDIEHIKSSIQEESKHADIIITTGGVSVGKYDYIKKVYGLLNIKTLFTKVKMKPGTPVTSGIFDETLILSVSGNPFAAMVNFQVLFWLAVEKYYGCSYFRNKVYERIVKDSYLKPSKLNRFVRAKADGEFVVLENLHNSSVISNFAECNCLVLQNPNEEIKEGDKVNIIYLF